jgi:hypothetical protein
LLVEYAGSRVAIDGGAFPLADVGAWLVTDEQAELTPQLRRLASVSGLRPSVAKYSAGSLTIRPRKVVHTSHPAFGYEIIVPQGRVVWAPEFLRFPRWAAGANLMFAEAAGFSRPILFAKRVGGHAHALEVCQKARRLKVKCLILAHIGRPTIRALDAGWRPDFGEVGEDGAVYILDGSGTGGRPVN